MKTASSASPMRSTPASTTPTGRSRNVSRTASSTVESDGSIDDINSLIQQAVLDRLAAARRISMTTPQPMPAPSDIDQREATSGQQQDSGRSPEPPSRRSKARPYRMPPGLKYPLHFYLGKPWVKLGEPIRLFEHLHKTYGPISHYRFLGTPIVFVNDPAYVREVLINQASSFIKERTLQRMKILLGEGLITSDDPIHMRQRRIAAPAFHRQRISAYGDQIVAITAAESARWQTGQRPSTSTTP